MMLNKICKKGSVQRSKFQNAQKQRLMSSTKIQENASLYHVVKDMANKTKFSTTELESLYTNFTRNYASRDGLGQEEFGDQMNKFGITDPVFIKNAFRVFDTDKSGTVDFREFASGISLLARGSMVDKYDFAFRVWDEDGNNLLDKKEFENFLRCTQGRHKLDKRVFEQIWADLDVNGNGALTVEECKRGLMKHQIIVGGVPFSDPELIDGLSQGIRELIAIVGSPHSVSKGEEIRPAKGSEKEIMILQSGSIGFIRNGVHILEEQKGAFFGGESILDLENLYSVVATSDCTYIRLHMADLIPLIFHEHPGIKSLIENTLMNLLSVNQEANKLSMTNEALANDVEFQTSKTTALNQMSLWYHSIGKNGKLEIFSSKKVGTAEELSLAYSPGVAEPCLAIQANPEMAYEYTSKGHLVGVISNGTRVLGLGNIGAAASKPVMEGKAVLFKRFGGVDSFDIEINESDPQKFIDIVVSLEPTFGGINLEDIKTPDCFFIEKEVQRRMNIPIMHDDQHGTAIIAGAGLLNALLITGKNIKDIKVISCGAGAAGFTIAKYFLSWGVRPENLIGVDMHGVIYKGRPDLVGEMSYLNDIANSPSLKDMKLKDVIAGADVFAGLAGARILSADMLKSMNKQPIVFALANPTPEITYTLAKQTRDDVIMATGRSDFPNQVNNVCAFPYIFRGALDCRAVAINEQIKKAATTAIAMIAREDKHLFGPEYIIPKPFDSRLKIEVSAAVAQAAMDSGVARKTLNIAEYKEKLRNEILS